MNRHFLPLCAAMLCACIASGQSKNFKAVSLNVDGLPESLLGGIIKMNEGGPLEAGSKAMGEFISTQRPDWDLFALSEDFNFEDELKAGLGTGYTFGTNRGKMYNKLNVLTSPFDTDGLNVMVRDKSGITFSGQTYVRFTDSYGTTGDGSDELIKKGFRYYLVNFGDGLTADLYIHHMDAETDSKSNAARESNVKQIVQYIFDHDASNTRPIIIMGDTNCRYTRDNLQAWVFDAINNHEYNGHKPYQVRDPWVDFRKWGKLPLLGAQSQMIKADIYGQQYGEVVDKIWYINNKNANGVRLVANSFINDEEFKSNDANVNFADHPPIVCDFTIEKIDNPENVFVPEPQSDPLNGKIVFLRNMQTGEFLSLGASWGTMAVSSPQPCSIQILTAPLREGCYILQTNSGYLGDYQSGEFYMDKSSDSGNVMHWEIVPTEDNNVYELYANTQDGQRYILSSEPDWNVTYGKTSYPNHIKLVTPSPQSNDKFSNVHPLTHRWQIITPEEYSLQLPLYANSHHGMDATGFMKAASFPVNAGSPSDSNREAAENCVAWEFTRKDSKVSHEIIYTDTWNQKDFVFVVRTDNSSGSSNPTLYTLHNTIKGLPDGKYKVSGDFLCGRVMNTHFNVTLASNGNSSKLELLSKNNESDASLSNDKIIEIMRSPDRDLTCSQFINVSGGELTITIDKTEANKNTFFAIDNFTLTYYGSGTGENYGEKTISLDFPENEFSSIILPFDAQIPENVPLTIFPANSFEEKKAHENSAGEKIEYHFIGRDANVTQIKANVPYIARYVNESPQSAPRRNASTTTTPTHKVSFTGYPVNWKDQYRDTQGILTGTLTDTTISGGHYQMFHNEYLKSAYLEVPEGGSAKVEANRVYINGEHNLNAIAPWGLFEISDDILTVVEEVADDAEETITDETPVDVYTTGGILLRRGVTKADALTDLPRGLYILTNGLTSLKLAK